MPTLSQWKILKNLMTARRKAAADAEEASQDNQENAEPTEGAPEEYADVGRGQSASNLSPKHSNDKEDVGNGYCPRNLSPFPDAEAEDQTSDVDKIRPTSGSTSTSDKTVRGENSSSTIKDAEGGGNKGPANDGIRIQNSSSRVRSAKRRSLLDITREPKEFSKTEDHGHPHGSLTLKSCQDEQITDRLSPDPRGRSTNNLDDQNASPGGRLSQASFAASDARSSIGNIPELLDPEKLRDKWRRASIQSARSSRAKMLSPSPQPVDVKANKSVKFSGHANVALLYDDGKDEQSESDDEDKLRISFEDVKRNLYENNKYSSRPRPKSCNLSDRHSKRSMESLITVSSFQPFENSTVFSFPPPSNSGRFKKTAQLLRSKTSPHLFTKHHLSDGKSAAEESVTGRGENTFPERWRLKSSSSPKSNHAESPSIRTGSVEADHRVSSATGTTNNRSPWERVLRRKSSRLSLPGSDVITDRTEDANESNLIIRGGPQITQTVDASSVDKKPLNRTSSVRNGIYEVSRWSMATQSIVTEQCASPVNGSRPSSGILQPQQETIMKDTEMPEEVQNKLQKLGFRKRDKSKKKKSDKSGKKSSQKKGGSKTDAQRIAIDLKRDPMLLKVQKKNRNVGKFTSAPELMPNAVCFEMTGTSLSHGDVIRLIKPLTDKFPEVKIQTIQFVYRSLVNSTPDMDNRWIINTNSLISRNRLAGSELIINGQVYQLRRYDDVITSEYQQFMRMMEFVKMMNSRKILG